MVWNKQNQFLKTRYIYEYGSVNIILSFPKTTGVENLKNNDKPKFFKKKSNISDSVEV